MARSNPAQIFRCTLGGLVAASLLACAPGDPSFEETVVEQDMLSQAFCREADLRRKRVDVLLVVDDSPSMAPFLPTLAENFDDFIAILHDPEVDSDYRFAVTTTSVPGPGCDIEDPPVFRSDSCLDHLEDFVVPDAAETPGGADVRSLCEEGCPHADLEMLPTALHGDSELRPRPWIERTESWDSNVPDGVTATEALTCIGLRGAGGCRFESPLEAMWRAIDASYDDDDPGYGFLRDEADLAVVFITNEDDCSVGPGGADLFSADGDRVFWPDLDAPQAQSGICWNAGSECVEAEEPWLDCTPVMHDAEGNVTDDDTAAVLQPLERYVQRIEDLRAYKRGINSNAEVFVAAVVGARDDGTLRFLPPSHNGYEGDEPFAIGPGCTAGAPSQPDHRRASPGLRLSSFADALGGETHSVCADDYGMALQRVATLIRDQIQLLCTDGCAADTDPWTSELDHDCVALELRPGEDPRPLLECKRQDGEYLFEDDDYVQPDDDTNICAVFLTDVDQRTASPYDDVQMECEGTNIGLRVARRPGHPAPIGTCTRLRCSAGALECAELP